MFVKLPRTTRRTSAQHDQAATLQYIASDAWSHHRGTALMFAVHAVFSQSTLWSCILCQCCQRSCAVYLGVAGVSRPMPDLADVAACSPPTSARSSNLSKGHAPCLGMVARGGRRRDRARSPGQLLGRLPLAAMYGV